MTAKEYFRRVREAERELYMIRQQKRRIREMAGNIRGMSQNGIRSPSARSRTESMGITLADLDAEFRASEAIYGQIVQDARNVIAKIPQIRFREVLTYRYLCGHSWKTISDEMDFSNPKSVYKVHGLALLEAQKILCSGE